MSETAEKVILSIKVDYSDSVDKLAKLSEELSVAKKGLKDLQLAGLSNTAEAQRQSQAVQFLSTQYRQENKALQDSVKSRMASTGSLAQMRAQLSTTTAEYINLSKAERKTAEGKELLNKLRSTSDELKQVEKAMGDNRREVGNYEIAAKGLEKHFNKFGISLETLKNGFSGAKDVIKGGGEQFTSFNGILKLSLIGVIAIAVGALVAVFTRFQPVVDKVEQVMGSLNAVVDVAISRFVQFGQGLLLIAQGKFEEGIEKTRTAFDGISTAIGSAIEQGAEWVKALQDIEDGTRANIIENSQLNKEIDQLLLKAKNRTLTEKERLSFLDKASEKEKKAFENTKSVAQQELDLAQSKYDNAVKNGLLDDKIEDARANAIANINNLESDSLNLREKITNRRDALIDSEIAKREAASAAIIEADKKVVEEIDKLLSDFEKKAQEDTKVYYDELRKKRIAEDTELKNGFTVRKTELANQLSGELITKEDYNFQSLQLETDRVEAEIALAKKRGQDTTDLELQLAQSRLAIKQNEVEKKGKLNDADVKSATAVASSAAGLIGELAATAGEGTALQKQLALTNVALNLGTAIGNLVASTSAPSPDNLLTGGISGFIKYAAGLSQVLAAIGSARSIIGGAAAGGGDFMTTGPTLLLVGDNPGGVERISVEPISGRGKTTVNRNSGLVAMAGGGTLTSYGGYGSRNNGQSIVDYDALAMSLSKVKIITKVSEINRAQSSLLSATNTAQIS